MASAASFSPASLGAGLPLSLAVGLFAAAAAVFLSSAALPRGPGAFVARCSPPPLAAAAARLAASLVERSPFSPSLYSRPAPADAPPVAARLVAGAPVYRGKLWLWLARVHAPALLALWCLTLAQAAAALAPPRAAQALLQHLERGRAGLDGPALALVVGALCLALAARVGLDALAQATTSSRLQLPCEALLSSLIFRKTLRLDGAHDGAATAAQAKKAVINHLRLDTWASPVQGAGRVLTGVARSRAVAAFGYSSQFPLAVLKLVFASAFIARLVGWANVLLGVAAAVAMMPVSSWLSRRYSAVQFGLMQYRDARAAVLGEVLRGLRQMRLAGLEPRCEAKLHGVRARELSHQRQGAVAMCLLVVAANLASSLLAALPLAASMLRAGAPSTSAAFTALGLFATVKDALTHLPLTWAYLVESWASCERLDKFLRQPERPEAVVPSQHVAMDDATVAWPGAAPFRLRNLCLRFPAGELSLITGPTGSGKSLLLSALLGEARLLGGVTSAPVSGQGQPRIAFVSPRPWLQNTTIRDNILFGSPYDAARYRDVLEACALCEDLRVLADGDLSVVGPGAVSISGGQRWRISLARALYSRADTIVMGDVLSAVDARVRQWLVDEALCGSLARGRTRILATHHETLCRPRSSYAVRLAEGRAEPVDVTRPLPPSRPSPAVAERPPSAHEPRVDAEGETPSSPPARPGRLPWAAGQRYMAVSGGGAVWVLIAAAILAVELTAVARDWWLQTGTVGPRAAPPPSFVAVYLGLSVGHCLILGLKCLAVYMAGFAASRAVFSRMAHAIPRVSLRWAAETEQGEVLARFTSDLSTLDLALPHNLAHMLECLVHMCAGVAAR